MPRQPKLEDKKSVGCPSSYREENIAKAYAYVDKCKKSAKVNLPTNAGLSLELKCDKDTIVAWGERHEGFLGALRYLKSTQEVMLWNNSLGGDYNPAIAKLGLHNHGYSDKQTIDQKTIIEGFIVEVDVGKSKNPDDSKG